MTTPAETIVVIAPADVSHPAVALAHSDVVTSENPAVVDDATPTSVLIFSADADDSPCRQEIGHPPVIVALPELLRFDVYISDPTAVEKAGGLRENRETTNTCSSAR